MEMAPQKFLPLYAPPAISVFIRPRPGWEPQLERIFVQTPAIFARFMFMELAKLPFFDVAAVVGA